MLQKIQSSHLLSIAPMLDVTDRFFRQLIRIMCKNCVLYTEMINTQAILFCKEGYEELLKFDPIEKPLVLQLGGNDKEQIVKCAKIAQEMGYDEVNLNVGCPSNKVSNNNFGACLMKQPELIAAIMKALDEDGDIHIPYTVKCRLGVDDCDSYEFVYDFVNKVSKSGVRHFIIHARKCILKGLSTTQNRNVPPLMYERVYQLQKDFKNINFTINGGFNSLQMVKEHLDKGIYGVMIGRLAYNEPYILANADEIIYNKTYIYNQEVKQCERRNILQKYCQFIEKELILDKNINYFTLIKPITNFYANERNNKLYRQYLSDSKNHKQNFTELVFQAVEKVQT